MHLSEGAGLWMRDLPKASLPLHWHPAAANAGQIKVVLQLANAEHLHFRCVHLKYSRQSGKQSTAWRHALLLLCSPSLQRHKPQPVLQQCTMLAICEVHASILQAIVDRLHADQQRAAIAIEGGGKIDAAYHAFAVVKSLKRKAYIQDLTGHPCWGQVSSTQFK